MPETVTVRPFVEGRDEDAWLKVINATRAETGTQVPFTRELFKTLKAEPDFDPAGCFVAEVGGDVVGVVRSCTLGMVGDTGRVIGPEVLPAFRRQDVGTALIERAVERLREHKMADAWLTIRGTDPAAHSFAQASGFQKFYEGVWARRPLTDLPDAGTAAPGVRARERGTTDADAEVFADLINHTQSATPGFKPKRAEVFRTGNSLTEPDSRIAVLHHIAEVDGKPVGLLAAQVQPASGATDGLAGQINLLGVLEPFRRRGVAKALVLHALAEFKKRGVSEAVMSLNWPGWPLVSSATRPVEIAKLADRLGFKPDPVTVWYERKLG